MKSIISITSLFLFIFLITSCGSNSSTTTHNTLANVTSETPIITPTISIRNMLPPTLTVSTTNLKTTNTPISTLTIEPSTSPTLKPEQAGLEIMSYMQGTKRCNTPCFLGVVPGKTTVEEAKDIFTHLRLQVDCKLYLGQEFCWVDYKFNDGLRVSGNLLVQNQIIWNITEYIVPESPNPNTAREWLAFSPETLINIFGSLSNVSVILGTGPQSLFQMIMVFDQSNLIVEYDALNLVRSKTQSICPLTDSFDSIRIWMGEDPVYPPKEGIPIDKATSLTIKEFSDLLIGNPDEACFQINGDMFP